MTLNFTTITENNVIRDLTTQVNNIGEELTKERNIFDITEDLVYSFNKSQKVKLTDDRGLAKTYGSIKALREIKEPGYYYINARTLAMLTDKPDMESIDVVLQVLPLDSSTNVVQHLYTLSTNNNQIRTMYRYVSGNSSSEWQFIQGLPSNKNAVITGSNVEDLTSPGVYFVRGMTGGMPSGVDSGFLGLSIDSNDNRLARLTDAETGKEYINTKKSSGVYIGWNKEFEPEDIQRYIPTKVNPPEGVASYNISIYKSDNTSFNKAIENHISETKETFISFYCQGGVSGNPTGLSSSRGIVMVDTSDVDNFYGIYNAVGTDGRNATGSVVGGNWSSPKNTPSYKELWTGAQSFSSIGTTKNLADDISNYSYVEVYTKHKTAEKTKGNDDSGTICHKFYLDGSSTYVCSGTFVSGERTDKTVPITEFYRVGINFSGTTWKIVDSAVQSNKTQYVTRIIGINMP
ncbi:tail fiber protein [Staphylococcus phage vB_SsapH-Golestan-105-M]|nr:tail fiber protein [Staphylococcus phage vB_SsapH-Golestan-105-M]